MKGTPVRDWNIFELLNFMGSKTITDDQHIQAHGSVVNTNVTI